MMTTSGRSLKFWKGSYSSIPNTRQPNNPLSQNAAAIRLHSTRQSNYPTRLYVVFALEKKMSEAQSKEFKAFTDDDDRLRWLLTKECEPCMFSSIWYQALLFIPD